MRILFIGGTGNISSHCASLLHQQEHEVWLLTRGKSVVPAEYRAVIGDRHDPTHLQHAAEAARPDVVINFLGYTVAELELDHAAFAGRVGQYIFISSATVYEKPPRKLPITEDSARDNPFWDYAVRKIECELRLERWRDEESFPMTIVRPSHTYSERWIPNAISSSSYTFAARLEEGRPVYVHDDGQTPWTLTNSRDFAAGLAGLVGNSAALGKAFHITSDEVLTWNHIYAQIANSLGAPNPQIVPIPARFICEVAPRFSGTLLGDKAHPGIFDNTRLRSVVPGFKCSTPFAQGLAESIDYLRRHPELQNRSAELDTDIDRILALWRERRPAA